VLLDGEGAPDRVPMKAKTAAARAAAAILAAIGSQIAT
jgi:hypothetical protein